MEDTAASILGGLLILFLLICSLYSTLVWSKATDVLWESDKWSCTKMIYPSQEKKEVFSPYCVQWSIEK